LDKSARIRKICHLREATLATECSPLTVGYTNWTSVSVLKSYLYCVFCLSMFFTLYLLCWCSLLQNQNYCFVDLSWDVS